MTMKKIIFTSLVFLILFLYSGAALFAQPRFNTYMDLGSNDLSDGLFFRTSGIAEWTLGKFSIEGGAQFDFKSTNENFLTGTDFAASWNFKIAKSDLDLKGFARWTLFSGLIRIPDYGIQAGWNSKYITAAIGTHYRTWVFSEEAQLEYNIGTESRVHEDLQLLYLIGLRLKPRDNDWNIGLNMTNIDYFIISETDEPSFNISGSYKTAKKLKLFGEVWYKSTVAYDSDINYTGVFLRAGIIWKIGK
jgi:hypothetical protein